MDIFDMFFGGGGGAPLSAETAAATEGVTTTTTKEHVEDVHGVHSSATPGSALLDALLARLVVQLPLLGIRQNLIGHRDFLELVSGLRIFVGVIFHRQLPIRFL